MGKILTLRDKLYSKPLIVTLDGLPPSVNHTYGFGGRRVFKKPEALKWQQNAIWVISKAAIEVYGTTNLITMKGLPIRLELSFIRPSWRSKLKLYVRPDISNLVKITEDTVCEALGRLDDSSVIDLSVHKIERDGPVRTEIRFEFIREEGN